ncbi:hypothetical protein WJX81_002964 [Elliptochloris bilobata]|uniref:GAF domain-containing protein n=1 Tax=Elliptochloris bilobata TaxID=381761 RepID=A0AAW1R2J8_9CHLO
MTVLGAPRQPKRPNLSDEELQPLEDMGPVSDAKSCHSSSRGLPYRAINTGPPKPPCNRDRVARLRELDVLDKPPDPEIEHIVQLACMVFGTENALVALLEGERIFIRNATGNFSAGDFPWRYSFCGYTLVPKNPTAMVIEDALEDARFRNNAFVTGGFGVRFYVGTPLVASDGHRLGTLCFADAAPRKFDAGRCSILNNMAELVVRELERVWALRHTRLAAAQMQQVGQGLLRAMDCFQEAIMMVDVREPGWRIMHLNQAAIQQTGVTREVGLASRFWGLFEAPKQQSPANPAEADWRAAAAARKAFVLHDAAVHTADSASTSAASSSSVVQCRFSLRFRRAATEALDANTPAIGIPSYMPMCTPDSPSGAGLFFMSVHETMRVNSASASGMPAELPFESLELGPMLGKGGYGVVYRGLWNGQRVAVKVIDDGASVPRAVACPWRP